MIALLPVSLSLLLSEKEEEKRENYRLKRENAKKYSFSRIRKPFFYTKIFTLFWHYHVVVVNWSNLKIKKLVFNNQARTYLEWKKNKFSFCGFFHSHIGTIFSHSFSHHSLLLISLVKHCSLLSSIAFFTFSEFSLVSSLSLAHLSRHPLFSLALSEFSLLYHRCAPLKPDTYLSWSFSLCCIFW